MGLLTLDKELLPERGGTVGGGNLKMPEEEPRKERVYLVTDTSWWMENGWQDAVKIMEKAPKEEQKEVFYIIPSGVMRELDGLKKSTNQKKAKRALESTKQIEKLISLKRAWIETKNKRYYNVLASKIDEEVVAIAERLKNKLKKEVRILTTDRAMAALAKQKGIIPVNLAAEIPFWAKCIFYVAMLFFWPISIPFLLFVWLFGEKSSAFDHALSEKKEDDPLDDPFFGRTSMLSPWYDEDA